MRRRIPTVLAPVILALVACACNRVVKVVIPDNFTGEAILVYDPLAGTVPECEGLSCVYRVPAGGELRIKSQELFARLHYESVQYADGNKAHVVKTFSRSSMVGLKSSTSDPGTQYVWVIRSTPAR